MNDEIIEFLEPASDEIAPPRVVRVPELTAIANIKLNARHSLRRCKDRILITLDISRCGTLGRTFPTDGSYLKQASIFMIRYSTQRETNPSTPIELLGSIAKEYRELQDLRERVRKAEAAAAKRPSPRVKLAEFVGPVSRECVARRPRRSIDFTKTELRAMLAEAVRNTG